MLATETTNISTDFSQLDPMVTATLDELGRAGIDQLPEAVAADAGYCNEQHMDEVVANKHIAVLVAPDKGHPRYSQALVVLRARVMDAQRAWLRARPSAVSTTQQTVEPLFGDTKHNSGVYRFHRRGRTKVRLEWRLLMMTHTLAKFHRHQLAVVGA